MYICGCGCGCVSRRKDQRRQVREKSQRKSGDSTWRMGLHTEQTLDTSKCSAWTVTWSSHGVVLAGSSSSAQLLSQFVAPFNEPAPSQSVCLTSGPAIPISSFCSLLLFPCSFYPIFSFLILPWKYVQRWVL